MTKRLCKKDPKLRDVDLSVILPVSGNRRGSPIPKLNGGGQ